MMNEDTELLEAFATESLEMLDEVEPIFIDLHESQACELDDEAVGTVFRLYHSIKGSSSFLGLENISGITHAAETLLSMLRSGKISMNGAFVDVQLETIDALREVIVHAQGNGNDQGFEALRDQVVAKLKKSEGGESAPAEAPAQETVAPSSDSAPSVDADELPPVDVENEMGLDELPEFEITDEMKQRFFQDSADTLEEAEQALLALDGASQEECARLVTEAFRHMHSFKGNCGFMHLTDMELLGHRMENVLGAIRDGGVESSEQNINILLKSLDTLKEALHGLIAGGTGKIPAGKALVDFIDEMVLNQAKATEKSNKTTATATAPVPSPKASEPTPPAAAAAEPTGQAATPQQRSPEPEEISKPASTIPATGGPAATARPPARRDIRVDVEKLDALINLVGELIIAEAMVLRHPLLSDTEDERLARSLHQLKRVSTDLQDVAMAVRMVPLAATFRRMYRLVHDLSRKVGKKASIDLEGEDTEVDKNVIEQIGDPLVHIIRNSLDHGIEPPEDRLAAGKEEHGRIVLSARHEGGEVWIGIHDDGRGLNREAILAKAVERGLIQGNPADLRDEEVYALIFEAGFSTAAAITDVSGRGVGMDVVKKNIENLNGKVRVKSVRGKGTDIILQIPLTLAIIDGMLVRVADTQYTLPLLSIRESIPRPPKDWITVTPDGRESVLVRGELIPIVRAHQIFKKEGGVTDLSKGILVVVQSDNEYVALLVDELLGQQQTVIKGLSSYLSRARGFSGCTVLGNGEVSLIIDINGIMKLQEGLT